MRIPLGGPGWASLAWAPWSSPPPDPPWKTRKPWGPGARLKRESSPRTCSFKRVELKQRIQFPAGKAKKGERKARKRKARGLSLQVLRVLAAFTAFFMQGPLASSTTVPVSTFGAGRPEVQWPFPPLVPGFPSKNNWKKRSPLFPFLHDLPEKHDLVIPFFRFPRGKTGFHPERRFLLQVGEPHLVILPGGGPVPEDPQTR